jgi:hypothetical protein
MLWDRKGLNGRHQKLLLKVDSINLQAEAQVKVYVTSVTMTRTTPRNLTKGLQASIHRQFPILSY